LRYGQHRKNGSEQSRAATSAPKSEESNTIPFAQRLTCTINEACEATGLGRTKLYELIGAGQIATTGVGRRRLVLVSSLQALLDVNPPVAGGLEKDLVALLLVLRIWPQLSVRIRSNPPWRQG
jgi:excisionase family DNA binding protein